MNEKIKYSFEENFKKEIEFLPIKGVIIVSLLTIIFVFGLGSSTNKGLFISIFAFISIMVFLIIKIHYHMLMFYAFSELLIYQENSVHLLQTISNKLDKQLAETNNSTQAIDDELPEL